MSRPRAPLARRPWGGADSLWGRAGADSLLGGADDDRLEGGAGADLFVFTAGGGRDTVAQFEDGVDAIDLEGGLAFGKLALSAVAGGVRVALAASPGDWIELWRVTLAQFTGENFL